MLARAIRCLLVVVASLACAGTGLAVSRAAAYGYDSPFHAARAHAGAVATLARRDGFAVRRHAPDLRAQITPRSAGVATETGGAISEAELSAEQASNFSRYASKLPVKAETPTIAQLSNGSVEFSARVPGEVPGSYAVYSKTVDAAGNTIGYVKTTIGPDGSVISVKDKFNP